MVWMASRWANWKALLTGAVGDGFVADCTPRCWAAHSAVFEAIAAAARRLQVDKVFKAGQHAPSEPSKSIPLAPAGDEAHYFYSDV